MSNLTDLAKINKAEKELAQLEAQYSAIAAEASLTGASMLPPPAGTAADLASLVISLSKGNWGDALIDIVGIIPLGGDAVKAAIKGPKIVAQKNKIQTAIEAARVKLVQAKLALKTDPKKIQKKTAEACKKPGTEPCPKMGGKNAKPKPPEQVHGGTFDVEVGPAYQKGSGVKPDAHNANVRILDNEGKTKDSWREVSGEATDSQKDLGTGLMRQSTHTEQKALTRKMLDDETLVITGQKAPCKNCQGAMRNATVGNKAKVEYQWREKVNGKEITQKEVWQNGKKTQKRKK